MTDTITHTRIIGGQFLLILVGPPCAGKSSVSKILMEKYQGLVNADRDRVKCLISQYESEKYRDLANGMNFAITETALRQGFSVIEEGILLELEDYKELTKERGIPFFIVQLFAPKDVLDKRFRERERFVSDGTVRPRTSPERFEELYRMYQGLTLETPLEFDSSTLLPEEIAKRIVDFIREYSTVKVD
jgi:predicted kinase